MLYMATVGVKRGRSLVSVDCSTTSICWAQVRNLEFVNLGYLPQQLQQIKSNLSDVELLAQHYRTLVSRNNT